MDNLGNKKRNNKPMNRKMILASFIIVSILFFCFLKDKLKFTDNIYDKDDNLKVSEEEIDKMISELSSEFGRGLNKTDIDYLLLYSIFTNNNISEIDKKRIYNLNTLINDCNYIDKDKAYRDLSLLKIKYTKRKIGVSDNVMARYLFPQNTIEIYDNNLDNDVLFHEMIHCIFRNEKTYNLPIFISEGVTELLENEYFSDKPYLETNNYVFEVALTKVLCELVGSDNVMLAYSTGDINYITRELEKNSNKDIKDINKLFNKLDVIFDDSNKLDKELYDEFYSLLEEVYKNKENEFGFDSLNCKYLMNVFNTISYEDRYLYYYDCLDKLGVSTKTYINSNTRNDNYTFEISDNETNENNKTLRK